VERFRGASAVGDASTVEDEFNNGWQIGKRKRVASVGGKEGEEK